MDYVIPNAIYRRSFPKIAECGRLSQAGSHLRKRKRVSRKVPALLRIVMKA